MYRALPDSQQTPCQSSRGAQRPRKERDDLPSSCSVIVDSLPRDWIELVVFESSVAIESEQGQYLHPNFFREARPSLPHVPLPIKICTRGSVLSCSNPPTPALHRINIQRELFRPPRSRTTKRFHNQQHQAGNILLAGWPTPRSSLYIYDLGRRGCVRSTYTCVVPPPAIRYI